MVYRPTARVLAVLELLQAYGRLSGAELARRLEVDVRTVRRYVTTLQDLGIPVEAELGRAGGYTLRPGYRLPPLMLTNDEVLVVTLGLQSARRSGLVGGSAAVETALAKIERVLPVELRDHLRALADTVDAVADSKTVTVDPTLFATLSAAGRDHRQVRMSYGEPGRSTERVLDPYAVVRANDLWYVVGYCHLREAMRTFRIDRIRAVDVLPTTFELPPEFDAAEYLFASFEAIPDRWQIEVLLSLTLDEAKRRVPRGLARLTGTEAGVLMQSSMPDLDDMARRLVALGCDVTILRPDGLRIAFLALAETVRRMALEPARVMTEQ